MATETEPDYTTALGKAPTSLQGRFADFIMSEEVGYDPASAKSKEAAFREGVRLAVALRIPFQASTTNREATAAERAERQAQIEADRVAKAAAPAKAVPAKKATAKAAKAAPAPAAAPAAARPPARRAPARRAPAAAAAPAATEAPF